jgi:hypothetical protein
MATNFRELRAGMSAAVKAAGALEYRRLTEEMSLHLAGYLQAVGGDLEIRAVFPDGRTVKINQFSEEPA